MPSMLFRVRQGKREVYHILKDTPHMKVPLGILNSGHCVDSAYPLCRVLYQTPNKGGWIVIYCVQQWALMFDPVDAAVLVIRGQDKHQTFLVEAQKPIASLNFSRVNSVQTERPLI